MTPDNYCDKALTSLHKCAYILRYSEFLSQQPTDQQKFEIALLVKVLSKQVEGIDVSNDAVTAQEELIKKHLVDLGNVYKSDKDYPSIKRNARE